MKHEIGNGHEYDKQRAQVVCMDIKRITQALKNATFDELKELHIELDGTYQNCIKNWDYGMYCFEVDFGFLYERLDYESIRDNLQNMKGKLRGYMLQLDPNAENVQMDRAKGGTQMSSKQKKLLADYQKIKQYCLGNAAIQIQDRDYPLLKDTLDNFLEYGFIRKLEIDSGSTRVYLKEDAFDTFSEQLQLMEVEEEPMKPEYDNRKVFIVHGHDHELLDEVELMLRRLDLKPIILMNEANAGLTIIEKIEHFTDVGFGIILYTACDEGRIKGSADLNPRARQNVVFEHGYLYAKLGRGHVAAINDENIEIPSDLNGVLYISRSAPDWKNQLMREMNAAGLVFDATRA